MHVDAAMACVQRDIWRGAGVVWARMNPNGFFHRWGFSRSI